MYHTRLPSLLATSAKTVQNKKTKLARASFAVAIYSIRQEMPHGKNTKHGFSRCNHSAFLTRLMGTHLNPLHMVQGLQIHLYLKYSCDLLPKTLKWALKYRQQVDHMMTENFLMTLQYSQLVAPDNSKLL